MRRPLYLLLVPLLLTIPVTYTYWKSGVEGEASFQLAYHVARYDEGDGFDRLPQGTADYIVEQLEAIIATNPDEQVTNLLVDAVISIVETLPNYQHHDGKVVIATDIDGLFASPYQIDYDSLLIYLAVNEDGALEPVVVHVGQGEGGGQINSPSQLEEALRHPWTGVNLVSSLWVRGNLYTTFHAPVEYQGDYYLLNFNGPRDIAPPYDTNAWHRVSNQYLPSNNVYWRGSIVAHRGGYYIATQAAWGVSPEASWAWAPIDQYQPASYSAGDLVYRQDLGETTFWRALRPTSLEAGEEGARQGHWRQINNGWIGRSGDSDIKSYYFYHNTYDANDIVIYGVSAKFNYRYYQAIRDVDANIPPLSLVDGVAKLNDQYWRPYV